MLVYMVGVRNHDKKKISWIMCKNAHPAHDPSSENNVIDIFILIFIKRQFT